MKKIYLLSLILSTSIFANEQTAIKLYNQKQYKKAYQEFSKLLKKDNFKSVQLNLYLAKTALKLSHYKEALGITERVLLIHPNNIEALYLQAKLYYLLKSYKLSKKYFEILKIKTNNQSLKTKINNYLIKINNYLNKPTLNIKLSIGIGYDSNINNTSNDETWYINNTNVQNPNKIKASKTITQLIDTNFNYKYFNNKFLIYAKQYTSDHSNDYIYMKESPAIINIYKNINFKTQLNLTNFIYDKKHYLYTYGIEENIKIPINNILSTLNLKIDNYLYKDSTQNSTLYSISNKLNYSIWNLLVGFEKNKAHKANNNIGYNKYNMQIGIKYPYNSYLFNTNFHYNIKKYHDTFVLFNKKEIDKEKILNISLLKKYTTCSLEIIYNRIINDSNIEPFEYNKWNLSINIIKKIKGL